MFVQKYFMYRYIDRLTVKIIVTLVNIFSLKSFARDIFESEVFEQINKFVYTCVIDIVTYDGVGKELGSRDLELKAKKIGLMPD